jgi:hypothetical protein
MFSKKTRAAVGGLGAMGLGGLMLMGIAPSPVAGRPVADSVAEELRGGACPKLRTVTCPKGQCAGGTIIKATMGTFTCSANPTSNTKCYAGCGNYISGTKACAGT